MPLANQARRRSSSQQERVLMPSQMLQRPHQERTPPAELRSRSSARPRSAWRTITAPFRAVVQAVTAVFFFLVSMVAMVATAAISILAVPIAIFVGLAIFAVLIMAAGGVMDAFL
ncbi:MAG: hypothetical protein KY475_22870 [Planctomycetes bacterium]|nr:hypothetical protein [Planctomycetota bacterium]